MVRKTKYILLLLAPGNPVKWDRYNYYCNIELSVDFINSTPVFTMLFELVEDNLS